MSEIKVNKISPRTACGTVTVGDSGDAVCVSAGVPVTVQGDLKSPALKATDGGVIISQSGTTITVGASGDTVALASGASQTGFGSPGQLVDWQTDSIKTTGFTAVTSEGYFCNTSGGGFNCTLPAGSAGSVVALNDYANSFSANNLTIVPDGSDKIGGIAGNAVLNTLGQTVTLVFVDATKGWQTVQDSSLNVAGPAYVTATGGSPCAGATCGDYKIHTFTGPGTLVISCAGNSAGNSDIDYLVVAGGGGGGPTIGAGYEQGGGGAGGYRESKTPLAPWTTGACTGTSLTLSATPYAIVVGGGGAGGVAGATSSFATISSGGGGHGRANPGGSGGGTGGGGAGGSGNVPPTAPPQGFPGGGPSGSPQGSGGGGASAAGSPAPGPTQGGSGGAGFTSCIGCAPVARGGGGGGSKGGSGPSGGGAGASGTGAGTAGTCNTGGGGGAAYGGGGGAAGGGGGSGIVIVRYKFQ